MGTNTLRPRTRVRPLQGGMALIMTLITLSVLALLLVGFLSTMLVERRAASTYEETQRAKLIAQGAVSHAVDLLRTNIPEPARIGERPYDGSTGSPTQAPGENWVINPGRLTVLKSGAQPEYIPLHTGEVTAAPAPGTPRDADSVDLNEPLPGDSVPAITGTAAGVGRNRPPMRVRWSNLLRDPSQDPSQKNPLVGRYAFWIDDENARLNFNTALGKPVTNGTDFGAQLNNGFVTPLFERGDAKVNYSSTGTRQWSLGRPQSVNLDVLFDDPTQLQADKLLAQTFLHGFARYPEAIKDYVALGSPEANQAWYAKNKFNLTFYSRSPEFNAFGKSRYFTTYVPLSLEAGPNYQLPFIHDPSGSYTGGSSEVLSLNSLFGSFGFTSAVTDDDDGSTILGGNVINDAQKEMLLAYMRRKWPGFDKSFVDKYGDVEATQIALNALLMARMATADVTTTDVKAFSEAWAVRTTSVNYSPDSTDHSGSVPERFYWRIGTGANQKLALPQMPGPHITEVRLIVKAVSATGQPPHGNASELDGYTQPVYLQYKYEVEYYMHPMGPVVDIGAFPIRMDFLKLSAIGPRLNANKKWVTTALSQQFGPDNYEDTRAARNWNQATNLGRLALYPEYGLTLGPLGARLGTEDIPNRRIAQTPYFTVGARGTVVPDPDTPSDWDPQPFEATKATTATLQINFRPGMGVRAYNAAGKESAKGRPRQMIPLGMLPTDTLEGSFTVSLTPAGRELAMSWQIRDPRLSGELKEWTDNKWGPGPEAEIGTPGDLNRKSDGSLLEPDEFASERSKFRYLQRAADGVKQFATTKSFEVNRGDEYQTDGRTASPGYWSLLHTGMQTRKPWQTLDFGPASATNNPPDWLLLDLMGATYPMTNDQWKIDTTLPDEFSTPSFMNSTAGQVNLNTRIYPQTAYFKPPERRKPLEGVFKNLRSDNEITTLLDEIQSYQTDTKVFDYVGRLGDLAGTAGSASTQWERESLLRNMAGCLTTKSNTFGVWGVSQVVKKVPKNLTAPGAKFDQFENGDQVVAEKRFYALVERYVWAGRDGVPGNAHVNASTGVWDRLAKQSTTISTAGGITDTLFQLPGSPPLIRQGTSTRLNLDPTGTYPVFDGPERVAMNKYTKEALGQIVYSKSSLEDAYNPPQAAIKYRVVYFKYLDQ